MGVADVSLQQAPAALMPVGLDLSITTFPPHQSTDTQPKAAVTELCTMFCVTKATTPQTAAAF